MPGRYIINQTSGKRVVILDEDADKVEGGYFDTDGTWHAFGSTEEGMIYVGKSFKLKVPDASGLPSSYSEIPVFLTRDPSEASRPYIMMINIYKADNRVTAVKTKDDFASRDTVTLVNNDGTINVTFVDTVFTLPYGLVPDAKNLFDMFMEEV